MPRFSDMIGHADTIACLKTAVRQNKVSHAYIIEGKAGIGKRMLADAFAAALLCDVNAAGGESATDGDACGLCRSCHQALTRNHPDIVYVTHEKPRTISVEEIREQVVGDVDVKPYNGRYKVYIIAEAEKMNAAAQNALLKTLEEPPSYVVILLLTTNSALFLDTIRSRCAAISLKPVQDELVIRYLMEHQQLPDYQARLCAAFAEGSIGKAVLLGSSPQFQEIRELTIHIASRAKNADVSELTEMVKKATQYRLAVDDLLELLNVWYRDVLYFKATRNADQLIFADQLPAIRSDAQTSSYEGIETILQALETARVRLNAYVAFELVMELLFLTIKEN